MSSFLGHSLAALSAYSVEKQPISRNKIYWLGWLIVIASAPDIDHIIRTWRLTVNYQELRITHSFSFSFLLSFATIIVLALLGCKGRTLITRSQQVILAGLSHLALDLLTGVNSLPLLWPFSTETFKLPFGLLPSAGLLNPFNYYFYRNSLIEIGVLAPLVCIAFLVNYDTSNLRTSRIRIGGLLLISMCFMVWAFGLKR
jgi:inner membrane protein